DVTGTNTNTVPAPPQNTIKILVCGDSITQGAEGDFTWRYRLWEWFRSNQFTSLSIDHLSPALEYVGPYNGTLPSSIGPTNLDTATLATWGTYAPQVDPAFSPGGGSSHFAVYGRPAWLVVDALQQQVATYQPDLVILHLGFNDFAWWTLHANDLLESMQKLVFMARLGRRDVKLFIADVSHRLLVLGREDIPGTTDEYNAMLAIKVREWSTPESPVTIVKVSEDYDCHVEACPAGADGLHPNALGDFQIARAYTRVLHEQFLFGTGPLEVP
ncbi:SGNH hydrolase, partial [Cryphonectria parasitica EP155]